MFQLMRYRGFDEARAKALGDAILAEPSNLDPSIINSMDGASMLAMPLKAAGVRAIDMIDPYYDMNDRLPERHTMAPLLAAALRDGTVPRATTVDGIVATIVARLEAADAVTALPLGTQVDVHCATPWSRQRVITKQPPEDDDGAWTDPVSHDIDGIPQVADAGLFQRILHVSQFHWMGRVVDPAENDGSPIRTEMAGTWG